MLFILIVCFVAGFLFHEINFAKSVNLKNVGVKAVNLNVPRRIDHQELTLSLAALNIGTPLIEPPKLKIPRPLPIPRSQIIELPQIRTNISYEDKPQSTSMEEPTPSTVHEKQAARLIVIRRKKMKKHKLKKLRKKMKFEWAKRRQRRELRKEKNFQDHLLNSIKIAQSFDAAQYAADKRAAAKEEILPICWYGVKYPENIIKQLIEEQKAKEKEKEADEKRRASMSPYVKDYLQNLPK